MVIECRSPNRNGMAVVAVKVGSETLALHRFNLTSSTERERFADTVCRDRSGIDRQQVLGERNVSTTLRQLPWEISG